MNKNRFHVYMRAVDPSFLEEAQRAIPSKKERLVKWLLPKVIFFVLMVIGLLIWKPWEDIDHAITAEDVAAAGYVFEEHEDARNIYYSILQDEALGHEVAQMEFTISSSSYSCRTARSDTPCDLFDFPAAQYELSWTDGMYSYEFGSSDPHINWLSWHSEADGVQYALYAPVSKADLLDTAADVLRSLNTPCTAAPEDAVNVKFDVFKERGMILRQTEFILDFDQFVYRIAEADAQETDISGFADFSVNKDVLVNGKAASLSFDEGRAGKICWSDSASGCVCSIYMPDDASEQALLQMAEELGS